MSQLRKRRYWIRWRRFEMRCEKLTGPRDPLWWGAVWAGVAIATVKLPRWLR